jgi:MoxR-like ATPase
MACTSALLRTGVLKCRAAVRMRAALDQALVGQDTLKHGVLLGLVAGEHVFIEGQPGCGKTMAAELAARASGLSTFFYQFHRDTRVSELVGHTVVRRERGVLDEGLKHGARTEVVQLQTVQGGVLTAEVRVRCVSVPAPVSVSVPVPVPVPVPVSVSVCVGCRSFRS